MAPKGMHVIPHQRGVRRKLHRNSDRHTAYAIRCMPIAVPKNVMALPQTVGFKAEAVDEEEAFDGWNAEWNRRVCDPREIRD